MKDPNKIKIKTALVQIQQMALLGCLTKTMAPDLMEDVHSDLFPLHPKTPQKKGCHKSEAVMD